MQFRSLRSEELIVIFQDQVSLELKLPGHGLGDALMAGQLNYLPLALQGLHNRWLAIGRGSSFQKRWASDLVLQNDGFRMFHHFSGCSARGIRPRSFVEMTPSSLPLASKGPILGLWSVAEVLSKNVLGISLGFSTSLVIGRSGANAQAGACRAGSGGR